MGRPRILAIIAGVAADVASSTIFGMFFGIILLIVQLMNGANLDHIIHDMDKNLHHSTPLLLASGGIGALGSMVGGFVAGWIAKYNRIFNGILTGICSVLLGFFMSRDYPIWYMCLGVVLTIGPAATGAYFADLIFGSSEPPPAPKQIIVHP